MSTRARNSIAKEIGRERRAVDTSKMFAFCYASGQIGFGTHVPEFGTLPIAKGPYDALYGWLSAVARHAYDNETLLVPGVPEAPDQIAGVEALKRWMTRAAKSAPKSVETLHGAARRKRGLVSL